MICTFYSSKVGYDSIVEILKTVLPKAKITTGMEDGMKKIYTSE